MLAPCDAGAYEESGEREPAASDPRRRRRPAIPTVSPTPDPDPHARADASQPVGVEPISGTVEICPPRQRCRPLRAGEAIPSGSTVDTRKGRVDDHDPPSGSAGAVLRRSVPDHADPRLAELALTEKLAPCSSRARAAQKKPKSRRLWGDGKGKFRTKGRYAAATVRGTRWLTQDSCAGTLVRVTQGSVSVRDNVLRKTVIVRKGKRYLARPRR